MINRRSVPAPHRACLHQQNQPGRREPGGIWRPCPLKTDMTTGVAGGGGWRNAAKGGGGGGGGPGRTGGGGQTRRGGGGGRGGGPTTVETNLPRRFWGATPDP